MSKHTKIIPECISMVDQLPDEVWKPIPKYPGYEASNMGRVKTFWCRGSKPVIKSSFKIRKQTFSEIGTGGSRLTTGFRISPTRVKTERISTLVLLAFKGECPPGFECCHEDGNEYNNKLSNLRWDTHKSNMDDIKKHGTRARGESQGISKLKSKEVLEIRRLSKTTKLNYRQISELFNIDKSQVSNIVRRKQWTHI